MTTRSKKSAGARRAGDVSARRTRSMVVMGALIRGVDRLSPRLGARVAARVFMSPRRARVPEREAAWLEAATPEVFEVGRFRLSGHRWAKRGDPVLLIHGWEGRGSQLGALALGLAEAGLQPVTVDLPAHGSTNGARTHLLEFAESSAAMVRHLGGVAGIVAHSFGAAGVTVAMRESLPVRRVAYLAPAEDFGHYPRVFGQWLGLSAQLGERMRDQIEGRIGITMAGLRGRLLAPKMRAPLLVVHDEDDVDVPWRDGQSYAEAWPGARLVTTRGLGHRRILRDPEVIDTVAAFLAEGGSRRPAGRSRG